MFSVRKGFSEENITGFSVENITGFSVENVAGKSIRVPRQARLRLWSAGILLACLASATVADEIPELADVRLDGISLQDARIYPDRVLQAGRQGRTIQLPPSSRALVALHLAAPADPDVVFSYRLIGLDPEPVPLEPGERVLRFRDLPRGEHVLQVFSHRAAVDGERVAVGEAQWRLQVAPPFWATDALIWAYTVAGAWLAVWGGVWAWRRRSKAERLNRDVRRAEAQKLESLSTLAGGIAHDFNNLLVGILGHSELARMEIEPGSRLDGYLERIEESAERAADLSRQMLFYSGRGSFQVRPLSLSDVVQEAVAELEGGLGGNVRLLKEIEKHLPPVEGDAAQLKQMVRNLILNAVEALESRQGMVVVATGFMARRGSASQEKDPLPAGNYVFLTVDDTGKGIAPTEMKRIFDPFFSTKSPGRGLGLAVVQGIVRGHDGRLNVSSTEGHGATFRVLFPALDRGRLEETAKPAPGPSGRLRPGHVLVVDDQRAVRGVAARHLERLGFEVAAVGSGEDALAHVEGRPGPIAWILMDISMPGMGGLEAARRIRRLDPEIPVVLTSGFSREDAFTGHEGIADGFIEKPYRFQDFEEQLEALGLVERSSTPDDRSNGTALRM